MERSIQRNGLINLLILLAVGVAAFAVARAANSLAGVVSTVFMALGFLVAAASWFQMRLQDRERLEKLEFDELAKAHSDTAMFEAKDADVFLAQRSREQFDRFFVPVFTSLLCIALGLTSFFLWRWLTKFPVASEIRQLGVPMALFGLFGLILLLLGKFSTTMARYEQNRLLRPGASYLLLGAYVSFAVAAGVIFVWFGFPKADFYVACGFCVLLALIAAETLINLVLEVYRPRLKGKAGRPLYESRLVGLLGQPEGLITTATQAIDYQFGFKISETWVYRLFVQRALIWLLLGQAALLVLSTLFVVIEAGEQGLLERCGRPVQGRQLLDPGFHVKWPWPIDQVYRFRTEQIQDFEIGTAPDETRTGGEGHVVLWTVAHTKEDNFLVANRVTVHLETTNNPATKRTPPLSLITGTIPVQFQITNLPLWAYENEDASSLLQDLATREVVRYLVGADMNEIMSFGRLDASQALAERIQTAVNAHKLGARIISVSLQDLHPPVKVAPEYEKVVGATHTKAAKILAARADDIKTNALASAQATNLLNQAKAESLRRQIGAVAQAALFTNQVPAFRAAPSVYAQRAYLQAFARSTANSRKYVVLTTNTHDVIQFDLQDKIRQDILDLSPKPAKP